jgi:metallo-beta-lactamase family protein
MENLSGHADYGEILRWLGRFPGAPQKAWMVHGEPQGAQSLCAKISAQMKWPAEVAQYLQEITL